MKREKMIKKAMINDTTWFLETVEANIPIATYDAPMRISPRYPETNMPISGSPKNITVNAYGNVNASAAINNPRPARYFPSTMSISLMGIVNNSSIVPLFCSSLISRIVIAGIKKIKTNGVKLKTLLNEASLARKSSLEKNHPTIRRNTEMTIYATGEKKYEDISRRNIGTTLFIYVSPPVIV
jgi:hypothetical protein